MERAMKVLTLCYEYPPLGGGGGRVAQSIARQLAARGHEVRVQTAALGWRSSEEDDAGVRVFRAASGRAKADTCRVHEMGLYCVTSFLPALRHICEWQPDVIHAHFAVPTGFLAWSLHHLTRVPYVLTAHLGDVPGGVPEQTDTLFALVNPLARRVWADAAECTAVSTFVQQLATAAYDRPVSRILNGVDLTGASVPFFPPTHPRRHIVFVGRMSVQKNPVFLVEALARISRGRWRATFIGDGPLRPDVVARIRETNLGDRVQLTGWLEAPAVEKLLRSADILAMPSLSEGLPVAAIEALKHGLAIISADIPGTLDVVDHRVNGYRVPAGDVAGFAGALELLITNDALVEQMRRASWKKVRAFELASITDQYERVLDNAARDGRNRPGS
jgi:glycosyltransferase involved in cell wall biosynthesis